MQMLKFDQVDKVSGAVGPAGAALGAVGPACLQALDLLVAI